MSSGFLVARTLGAEGTSSISRVLLEVRPGPTVTDESTPGAIAFLEREIVRLEQQLRVAAKNVAEAGEGMQRQQAFKDATEKTLTAKRLELARLRGLPPPPSAPAVEDL